MSDPLETLIVGGGISGLGCARRLCDAGRDFLLVTDRLGGRMHHSPDGRMNFGASYITADYRHVSRFVERGLRFRLREGFCQGAGRMTTLFHWRNLRFFRPFARFVLRLQELRHQLCSFRREAEHVPQNELVPRYPLLDRYCKQPAPELIQELGLGFLDEHYFRFAFRATLFTEPENANALFYLGVLFPVIVPTWVADFTATYARLTAGYENRVVIDRVTALRRDSRGLWEGQTAAGLAHRARNVVLAVPYHNARELYPVPAPPHVTSATMLHVRGGRQLPYQHKRFMLLDPVQTGVALIWQQRGGKDQLFSYCPRPDLAALYEQPEVLGAVSWKTALVISGAKWAPLVLEPGLYQVGDYNLCGLEDAYLTGLCAANHILRHAGRQTRGEVA
jgi:hypothetical protein